MNLPCTALERDFMTRISALLAYLLLVVGWVFVFLFRRHDKLAVYHAKQSIMVVLMMIASFVSWVVLGWLVTLIPLAGPLVAVSGFSLVMVAFGCLLVSWIMGIVYAWQAKIKPVPFVGLWAERLPIN
jgi:uncharacterized membrane protein